MKEFLLVLFGFVLAHVPIWLDRKRRLKTHWSVIRGEIELCRERASSLISDSIQSPLYRLPLSAYETSFPVLLSEGALSEGESLTMGRFFSQVQDINQGLDNTAAMLNSTDTAGLNREFSRNLLKARRLVESREGEDSLCVDAIQVVDAKVAKPWWKY
ncbi:MAG: hypothetical protein ACRD2L_11390 [Terriglobia bacterium]